jgi:hypothetical protein
VKRFVAGILVAAAAAAALVIGLMALRAGFGMFALGIRLARAAAMSALATFKSVFIRLIPARLRMALTWQAGVQSAFQFFLLRAPNSLNPFLSARSLPALEWPSHGRRAFHPRSKLFFSAFLFFFFAFY